ncbi:MAG: SMP-30/gluconolactonase/LRE family protein [Tepidisphaeraceae bacterium]
MTIEPLCNHHCHTGENPMWHPDDGCVYWTDIPAGLLYRYDPSNKTSDVVYRGEPVGGFTLQADGTLLLFRVRDVASFDIRTRQTRVLFEVNDDTMDRFNDVHADPLGRVFAGTIGKGWKKVGGLYRVETDGRIQKLFAGTACSNGMAFSPDEKTFYWTDTSGGFIYAFDYDRTTGALTNRREFYNAKGEGGPDGTAMDEHGNLWSTRWGGSRICVIDPSGKKTSKIAFPVPKVSCAIFGGPGDNELFVTTATGGDANATRDCGTLYRIVTSTRGRPRFRSRVLL